jgi:hypothetical protein
MKSYPITSLFHTTWETLTPRQMIDILDIRESWKQAKAEGQLKAAGYYSIMLLRELRKNKNLVSKINVEQAVDCINDLKFIHEPWYFFPVPAFSFSPSVLNHATAPTAHFTPPGEKMHNRNFSQLVYADAAFSRYCVLDHKKLDGTINAINELVAVLYTSADEFNDQDIIYRAGLVGELLKDWQKALILYTYANCRLSFIERCPNLFPGSGPSDKPSPPTYTGKMWQNLRYDLAETPAFQGFNVAGNANLYDALDYLEKKASTKPHKS